MLQEEDCRALTATTAPYDSQISYLPLESWLKPLEQLLYDFTFNFRQSSSWRFREEGEGGAVEVHWLKCENWERLCCLP